MFGGKADDSSFKIESNLQSMITWCESNPSYKMHIPRGDYDINGSLDFTSNTNVEIDEQAVFLSTDMVSVTVEINGYSTINSYSSIIGATVTLDINSTDFNGLRPEWYGALGDGVNDDSQEIQKANDDSNGKSVILSNLYNLTNAVSLTALLDWSEGGKFKPNDIGITLVNTTEFNVQNWDIYDTGTGMVDSTDFETLIDIMLNSGPNALLNWNGLASFGFDTVSSSLNAFKISHNIPSGTLIKFDASVEFGVLVNGPQACIDSSSNT